MTERLLYSITEVAQMLGIHRSTLDRLCKEGKITFVLVGRARKFAQYDLAKFIEEGRQQRCPSTSPRGRRTGTTISSSRVVGFTDLPPINFSRLPRGAGWG